MLYENQFGFRRKKTHSTTDAITKFVTDTSTCLDEKESVMAVFLDLFNAFDTIDHNILLKNWNFMEL